MSWLPRPRCHASALLALLASTTPAAGVEAGQFGDAGEGPSPQAIRETGSTTAAPADKRSFTLFSPTPRESMREMATDRPDQTESPYTVDAGRFQLEMDLVNVTFDRHANGSTRAVAWSVAPLNLKVGLLHNVDLQLIVDPYETVRLDDALGRRSPLTSGFGNLGTRLKVNFWGNDGGRTAFGMLASVKWPLPASTFRNGRTEWGLIFPLAIGLADGWELGTMIAVDMVADAGGGYQARSINSVTVGHALTSKLGMYVEALAAGPFSGSAWMGQLDVGWTYTWRDTVQIDWGANVGVAGQAPPLQPFAGLSFRF